MGPGSKNFELGWVRSIFLLLVLGWVSHLWFRSEFGKFTLKIPNFSIFSPSGQKVPGQRWVSFLFTPGQIYAQVRSGPISTQDKVCCTL